MTARCAQRRRGSEGGFSMIEVLVSLSITAIVAMALSQGTTVGYTLLRDSRQRAVARQMTASKIEELSLSDPANLIAQSYSESVTLNGFTLTRAVTISANSDGSRSVTVTASTTPSGSDSGVRATLSARLTSWSSS